MDTLDLPNPQDLPTLDDSERWHKYLDSLSEAKKRRERLRDRAEEIEQEIPRLEDQIEELRLEVATGDRTESDLEGAKEERDALEEELEEITENELPGQLETVSLLESKRDEIRSEEGDKLAEQYAEVQAKLQATKRILLLQLAEVCDTLEEYQSLKKSNDVGSYDPDVQNVPPVSGKLEGDRSKIEPQELRRKAEDLADTLDQLQPGEE